MTSSRRRLDLAEASRQCQQQSVQGDEDLALWTKGKNKVDRGGGQGPKFGAPPQGGGGESSSGQKRDMSKVKCFVCKKWGTMLDNVPIGRRREVVS
jgi:hypothetical protein